MSASEFAPDRPKAVRMAAELLREARMPSYPTDVRYIIGGFRQILLRPYSDQERLAEACGILNREAFRAISKDGFCTQSGKESLVDYLNEPAYVNRWMIFYNQERPKVRQRFTIAHELGHIVLGHQVAPGFDALIGMSDDPVSRDRDTEADWFAISLLAPAPAVFRLLLAHGFTREGQGLPLWKLTNPRAPFLRYYEGPAPDPEQLVTTSFGLSREAAHRRLAELPMELAIWENLDDRLYTATEKISHRAGWFCEVCHTRRRRASRYCPGCGHGGRYEYLDPKKPVRPVIPLREGGQFAFCSICGNAELPEDAACCPVCGCPVINPCENAGCSDGAFIRRGMEIIRGTHRCRPGDIFCGDCGTVTAFGRRYGPRANLWTNRPESDRCRMEKTVYPPTLPVRDGRLARCPACGSVRSIRDGRYCAECMQPLENFCTSAEKTHSCGPNDRFCRICGSPTAFQQMGLFPPWEETDAFRELKEREKQRAGKPHAPPMMIRLDGAVCGMMQE